MSKKEKTGKFLGGGRSMLGVLLKAVDTVVSDGDLLMALIKMVSAVVVNGVQEIVFYTPDFLELTGYEPDEEMFGRSLSSFLPDGEADAHLPLLAGFESVSAEMTLIPLKRKDGSCVLCSAKARRLPGDLILFSLTDLQKVLKDGLTGVASRQSFMLVGEQYLKIAHRLGKKVAVFFIDIDGLKEINEAFSHIGGDEAIKLTADAVQGVFKRDTDFVARYGGDELVALTMDPGSDPGKIVADIKAAVARNTVGQKNKSGSRKLSATVTFVEFNPVSSDLPMPTMSQLIGRASKDLLVQKAGKKTKKGDALSFLGEVKMDELAEFLAKKKGEKNKKV